jgi:hypothetical protein
VKIREGKPPKSKSQELSGRSYRKKVEARDRQQTERENLTKRNSRQ